MKKEAMKRLSIQLNNSQYPFNLTKEQRQYCKDNGFVVVYGHSDDLIEFDGAINYEACCYEGGKVYIDKNGIVEACDCECKYYQEHLKQAKSIEALWCCGDCDWVYKTDIPHEIFYIKDDEQYYCCGIIFDINEV